MSDLFSSPKTVEQVFTGAFRMEKVREMNFMPRLRGGLDYVMIKPTNEYLMEGMYLLYEPENGARYLKMAGATGLRSSKLRIWSDKSLQPDLVDRDWFNEHVIGVVVAEVKMVGDHFIDWPITGPVDKSNSGENL